MFVILNRSNGKEVDLLDANAHYTHVRFSDRRETIVSSKHLAPFSVNWMSNFLSKLTMMLNNYQKQLSPENTLNSSSETKPSNVSQDSTPNDDIPTSSKSPVELTHYRGFPIGADDLRIVFNFKGRGDCNVILIVLCYFYASTSSKLNLNDDITCRLQSFARLECFA